MAAKYKYLIDRFERRKKEVQDDLRFVETDPAFRLRRRTPQGDVDITDELKQNLRNEIEEYQRMIDDLTKGEQELK